MCVYLVCAGKRTTLPSPLLKDRCVFIALHQMGPQAKVSPVLAFLTNDIGDSLIFNAFFSIISYRPSWSQTCSLFALASQIFRLEGCYTMPGPAVTLLWDFDKYIYNVVLLLPI